MLASARGHGKIGLSNLLVRIGEVVEWLMAPVLKTGEVKASVGSNPTLSVPNVSSSALFVPNPCGDGLLGVRGLGSSQERPDRPVKSLIPSVASCGREIDLISS
jgi:hypothetical protein